MKVREGAFLLVAGLCEHIFHDLWREPTPGEVKKKQHDEDVFLPPLNSLDFTGGFFPPGCIQTGLKLPPKNQRQEAAPVVGLQNQVHHWWVCYLWKTHKNPDLVTRQSLVVLKCVVKDVDM